MAERLKTETANSEIIAAAREIANVEASKANKLWQVFGLAVLTVFPYQVINFVLEGTGKSETLEPNVRQVYIDLSAKVGDRRHTHFNDYVESPAQIVTLSQTGLLLILDTEVNRLPNLIQVVGFQDQDPNIKGPVKSTEVSPLLDLFSAVAISKNYNPVIKPSYRQDFVGLTAASEAKPYKTSSWHATDHLKDVLAEYAPNYEVVSIRAKGHFLKKRG